MEDTKKTIDFSTFDQVDIRVGKITDVQPVENADRLLKYTIDDGMGGRQIISGNRSVYPDPKELINQNVLFVANLASRKMRGELSEGMLLTNQHHLVTVDKNLPLGSSVN